ncbi:hypothetical protein BDV59DRAFT_208603 [Aspergillus ambiguus]|uniref:polyketide synthase alb1 n=1 Tax=Aspergillus ambiguus TaxID=176160 RepID=UPI003CCD38C8
MENSQQVYVFGDQTTSFDQNLAELLQAKNNTIVASFLERSCHALRQEISRLSSSKQKLFPRFTSLTDLVSRHHEEPGNPAISGALTCIYQLACFINYHGDNGHVYPAKSSTHLIGSCIGLLTCAAVSSCTNIGELLPLAVNMVVMNIHLGLIVMSTRELVDSHKPAAGCWCIIIFDLKNDDATHLINEFAQSQDIAPSRRPYISAVGCKSVSISGCPEVLDQLIEDSIEGRYKFSKAHGIHGPYHASHLYSNSEVQTLAESVSSMLHGTYEPQIPILSSHTGEILQTPTMGGLLSCVIEEILLRPICWDKVSKSCVSQILPEENTICRILPIGSSATPSLVAALQTKPNCKVEVESMTKGHLTMPSAPNYSGRASRSKIAIIGMSGRFPEADSIEEFWNLLYKGLDVHKTVPPDRWDIATHVDLSGTKRNTSKVPYGCWIREPGLFDPRFFNMSPREALQADPAQRLVLLTAAESLEMAGLIPDSTPSTQRDRVGVFYGMTSDDYREINSGQDIDTYFIPGGNRAFTPGRVNFFFKFSGPSISVDTACSSSLAAIHLACNSIWRNDCDTAITGGVNVLTNPDNHAGLDRGHFLSRTGNCNTFDNNANGYCRAEGAGTVILKRLEDAQADNDPILGIIDSAYTNHSAESVSITRPHVGAQAFIFNKLLGDTNTQAEDISYIEMHGTGTQAGDAVEMNSVLDVFAPDYSRSPASPLYLGSAKANVGHGESASGVTSLVKVLLMMKHNTVPPHCGIKTRINQKFPTDLSLRNVHIVFEPTPWRRPDAGSRKVFVNNFSAAGGNTALLLEDAPYSDSPDRDPREHHLIAVSACSATALRHNITSLVRHIDTSAPLSEPDNHKYLACLAYTTTARRLHHSYRTIVSATDILDLRDHLHRQSQTDVYPPVPSPIPKVAFAFTGQGAQYTGMGRRLYMDCAQFQQCVQRLDSLVQGQGFPSIIPLIDGNIPIEQCRPVITQLGTTCLQIAMVEYWQSLGIRPSVVVGHSLGDYAALYTAGVLTASDTIYLCGHRASLLEQKCQMGTHSMLAIRLGLKEVQQLIEPTDLTIACINGPTETVISGPSQDIDQFADQCSARSIKATKLQVPFAFHSRQVTPILETFENIAKNVAFYEPKIPFISSLLGIIVDSSNYDALSARYMMEHCRQPVNFLGALEAGWDTEAINGDTLWIEVGPHPICSGMIKATYGPSVTTIASLRRDVDPWKVISDSLSALYLAGFALNWSEYHYDFNSAHRVLDLPRYSWDLKNYWIPYAGDFCLTKGASPMPEHQLKPTALTTSAQRVVDEQDNGETTTVVVENNIADTDLNKVIQGHKVNGAALTSSSLYADIAQTIVDYMIAKYKPEYRELGLNVSDMKVPKPLIGRSGDQFFRVSAAMNWSRKSADIQVYSVNATGKKVNDHAQCCVKLFDCAQEQANWARIGYLIKRSISLLNEKTQSGLAHRLQRGMVYKLFSALVDYDESFKNIQEVVLDSSEHEATAQVKLQETSGTFHRNPFWIDSFGHLSGFIMNASDSTNSKTEVFVNHGWSSMHCLKKFSANVTYQTYVKMQPWKDSIWAGDVYIFEGDEIVALFGGIKFQGLARKVLDTVLPPSSPVEKSQPESRASQPKLKNTNKDETTQKKPINGGSDPNSAVPNSPLSRAIEILASEVGLSSSELTDDLIFADYGVDSLMSLTITGEYREQLDLDLDSAVFVDYPTLGEFKGLLLQEFTGRSSSSDSSTTGFKDTPSSQTSSDLFSDNESGVSFKKGEESNQPTRKLWREICRILAEELGVPETSIGREDNLPEIGLDSLMSLTVLGQIREQFDVDLPSDFFMDNPTLHAVGEALGLSSDPLAVSSPPSKPSTPPTKVQAKESTHPTATSILLQGNPRTSRKKLFLFPDGSGSASSYATIPLLGPDICVYGLNCPYMKKPQDLKCSLDSLTRPYVDEIRRRQPYGPYNVGGWSAGGICAFDAVRLLLLEEGEHVERLILLDSPFPIGLEKLPPRLYRFFEGIGLFAEGKRAPPEWLLPHFLAFIDSLDAYEAVPLPYTEESWHKKMPATYLVWARDGVCGKPGDPRPEPSPDGAPDPREMLWLLNDRTDLGPNQWDTLVGQQNIKDIQVLEGANHFTMMTGQNANSLSAFLAKAMAS